MCVSAVSNYTSMPGKREKTTKSKSTYQVDYIIRTVDWNPIILDKK